MADQTPLPVRNLWKPFTFCSSKKNKKIYIFYARSITFTFRFFLSMVIMYYFFALFKQIYIKNKIKCFCTSHSRQWQGKQNISTVENKLFAGFGEANLSLGRSSLVMLQKSVTGVAFSSQIGELFSITAVWKYPRCQRLFTRGFWFRPSLKKCLRPSADETKLPDARETKNL